MYNSIPFELPSYMKSSENGILIHVWFLISIESSKHNCQSFSIITFSIISCLVLVEKPGSIAFRNHISIFFDFFELSKSSEAAPFIYARLARICIPFILRWQLLRMPFPNAVGG